MGLSDYLNKTDKRVRVETQPITFDPRLEDDIPLTSILLLRAAVSHTHVNAAGVDEYVMTNVPNGVTRVLLDMAIQNNTVAAQGFFYTQRAGQLGMASPTYTAGGVNELCNPLLGVYSPFVMIEGTALHMVDRANAAGQISSFWLRYIDLRLG